MLLFYVRHGDPIYNPDSLTELGKEQAKALVSRMKECNPDTIYASSSNRAIMTAQPTAEALNKEIQIIDWCNESHAWDDFAIPKSDGGKRWCFYDPEIRKIFSSNEIRLLDKKWYEYEKIKDYNFIKGVNRVQSEVDKWMFSLGYEHDHNNNCYKTIRKNDERIALFAHQGFGFIFLSCLLDIPYPQISMRFDMGHSGLTVIDFSGDEFVVPRVLQMSNDSHIFANGISTDYQNMLHF